MSGHSKWHNIQARKGKQDAKKSNIYTKLARLITVAAQKGGDPATNFSLRLAIEKAKAVSMPKDNIDKAVKRGTGELNDEAKMEETLYEAFGPGGVQIIIKALTNNKNRTVSDIKHMLSVAGGSLGGSGSVMWNFTTEKSDSGLVFVAKNKVTLDAAAEEKLAELFSELEAHDDVEDYYTNAE